jgi:hypothetical protein
VCSLCGDLSGRPDWTQLAGTGGGGAVARHRARCAAQATALLRTAGLELRPWQRRFVVSDRRGRSLVVDDLPACWVAAEQLLGVAVDPLAPAAVASLDPMEGS